MSRIVLDDNEVFVDGVDVSDFVSSIEITYATGESLVRKSVSANTAQLARMLDALTQLAAPTEGDKMSEPSAGHVDAAVVKVYMDGAAEWRWRAQDTNGETVADSGEGYMDKGAAIGAARDLFPDAVLQEPEE